MTTSAKKSSTPPVASPKRTGWLKIQRDHLDDPDFKLLCSLAPQWEPLSRLDGTDTGFALMDTEWLLTTSRLKPDCSWLGLLRDEGPDLGGGPSGFGSGLSWLLRRADVVAVLLSIRRPEPYSRLVSLALSGHRVVLIETEIERKRDWIIEVKRLSRAPVLVISRETQDAEICICGAQLITSNGSAGVSS
jgi:hypothetical protein